MPKIKSALKKTKDINVVKRIETSGKFFFLFLMLDKSYTGILSIEPVKVKQSFSRMFPWQHQQTKRAKELKS